ncbi:hypothetical protein VNO78_00592 [Psophocarpus tetragonolobus]|uniref:Uncharacterized protein n=1 Tax=Psophocarpus tetragonolobus TaxID=3891 RepID=A0AAN9XU82_PSOTE
MLLSRRETTSPLAAENAPSLDAFATPNVETEVGESSHLIEDLEIQRAHTESNQLSAILCAVEDRGPDLLKEAKALKTTQMGFETKKAKLEDKLGRFKGSFRRLRLTGELKKTKIEMTESFTFGFATAMEQAVMIALEVDFLAANVFKIVKDGQIMDEE